MPNARELEPGVMTFLSLQRSVPSPLRSTMNIRYRFGHHPPAQRGFVIPFTAVCLTLLIGMVAFAVDLGMISVARTQAQHAADMAALGGTRTLTGDPNTNFN